MSTDKIFNLLDILEFVIKRKELIISIFFVSFVLVYLGVFLLVEEQFEATATIIPREEDASNMASGVLSSMKKMSFNLGAKSQTTELDLYKTIIYSRTLLEAIIKKFDLVNIYKLDTSDNAYLEKAIKRLRSEIIVKETEESAMLIMARSNTRQRAADITNSIIQTMNDKIIELKVNRSKQNRIFLEQRLSEISLQMKMAEDSLRTFQETSGLLEIKSQLQGILAAHTSLETELMAKQIQKGLLERLYDKESPQINEIEIQIQEFQKKIEQLRSKGEPGSPILALHKLPKTSVNYMRYLREVELNNILIEFIVPLYEQAKIEEKKDYPVLQIIDYAVPPARKSYPPRLLLAVIGALSISILVLIFLKFRKDSANITNTHWISLIEEIKHWNWKKHKI